MRKSLCQKKLEYGQTRNQDEIKADNAGTSAIGTLAHLPTNPVAQRGYSIGTTIRKSVASFYFLQKQSNAIRVSVR